MAYAWQQYELTMGFHTACALTDSICLPPAVKDVVWAVQEDLQMDLDGFTERYGSEPGKDDLTVLAPKQDDPTEQVSPSSQLYPAEILTLTCLNRGMASTKTPNTLGKAQAWPSK